MKMFQLIFFTKVALKMKYLDGLCQTDRQTTLNGNLWYQQQASRAVNQAIGRVIRHANDYGAVILCDKRFGESNMSSQLAKWMRPYVKDFVQFGMFHLEFTKFFKAVQCLGLERIQLLKDQENIPTVAQQPDALVHSKVGTVVLKQHGRSIEEPKLDFGPTDKSKTTNSRPLTSKRKNEDQEEPPKEKMDITEFQKLVKDHLSENSHTEFMHHLKRFRAFRKKAHANNMDVDALKRETKEQLFKIKTILNDGLKETLGESAEGRKKRHSILDEFKMILYK